MGLRRVLAQCRALVRKMLARPEQGDPGAEASAERVQRRFSDLVDTCSRFARDIRRDVKPTRPPRVSYSLTDHGLTVAKLGEPIFLYLRLSSALGVKPEISH